MSSLMVKLKLAFPRLYDGVRSMLPHTRRARKALAAKGHKRVFEDAYENNDWGNDESVSGYGSTLACTEQLRKGLPGLVSKLGIRVFLDAPCGDLNWMRHVDLGPVKYIGADIVPQLIARLQAEFPDRTFQVLDLINDPLPDADSLFCRDCLLHLSFEHIRAVFDNFRRSKCKYLITSTYPEVQRNFDIVTGEARGINLLLPPFNLPEPMERLNDASEVNELPRYMGVWRREDLS